MQKVLRSVLHGFSQCVLEETLPLFLKRKQRIKRMKDIITILKQNIGNKRKNANNANFVLKQT